MCLDFGSLLVSMLDDLSWLLHPFLNMFLDCLFFNSARHGNGNGNGTGTGTSTNSWRFLAPVALGHSLLQPLAAGAFISARNSNGSGQTATAPALAAALESLKQVVHKLMHTCILLYFPLEIIISHFVHDIVLISHPTNATRRYSISTRKYQ